MPRLFVITEPVRGPVQRLPKQTLHYCHTMIGTLRAAIGPIRMAAFRQ
jgi:hypothetical protein